VTGVESGRSTGMPAEGGKFFRDKITKGCAGQEVSTFKMVSELD
jgi:hypothetical protein